MTSPCRTPRRSQKRKLRPAQKHPRGSFFQLLQRFNACKRAFKQHAKTQTKKKRTLLLPRPRPRRGNSGTICARLRSAATSTWRRPSTKNRCSSRFPRSRKSCPTAKTRSWTCTRRSSRPRPASRQKRRKPTPTSREAQTRRRARAKSSKSCAPARRSSMQ